MLDTPPNNRPLRIVDDEGTPAHEYGDAASLFQRESEKTLLGMILIDADLPPRLAGALLEQVTTRLGTDVSVFSRQIYREIYAAMLAVAGRGLAPTDDLVDAEMRRRNVPDYRIGDIAELATIASMATTDGVPDSARVEGLCQNILDAYGRRQYMAIAQRIAQHAAGGTDLSELGERIGQAVEQVRRPTVGADTTIAAVGDAYMRQLADWRAHPGELRGTTSGLANVDEVTHGWRPGKLIVLAARMSVGKTAIALCFARAAAKAIMERATGFDHQVGIISLEMSNEDLFHRLIASQAGVDAEDILKGNPALDWDAIEEAATLLQAMPIRMVDAQGAANRANGQGGQMTVAHIREHARAWHRQGLLDLLIVDFLTMIAPPRELRGNGKNREAQVAYNIQALKNLAAELNIPVMVLAQLNRENEHAAGAIPQLHHLRDSDVIGQVADLAMFPVRWDYYRERGNDVPQAVRKYPKGYTELYLQKHRGGRVGAIPLYSDMATNRFWDWNDQRNAPVTAEGKIPAGWRPVFWPE